MSCDRDFGKMTKAQASEMFDETIVEVKANKARLDGCEKPHEFERDEETIHSKWTCKKCGGHVQCSDAYWYKQGFADAMASGVCIDCGVPVPKGQGLGRSAPEQEWTDRSQPRPITIQSLCLKCLAKRLAASGELDE